MLKEYRCNFDIIRTYRHTLPAVFAAILFAGLINGAKEAQAQQIWIGSANGWQQMRDHPEQWDYVRKNADGFYINFIELMNVTKADLAPLCVDFKNKNAYFESDSRNTGLGGFPDGGQFSDAMQARELNALLNAGFKVPYASLNYGIDINKLSDLHHIGMPNGKIRPVFAQQGPWTIGGDINGNAGSAPDTRAWIKETDGMSTDGPLSLWEANQGNMRAGSFSMVKYAHSLQKTAVVMVTPYDLQPRSKWLAMAQQCVREHEDAGAKPDIWDVFEYATDTPTLPETDAKGLPADTITGMAYWLIHHIKDPAHFATIVVPTHQDRFVSTAEYGANIVPSNAAFSKTSAAHQLSSCTFMIKNSSTWLDLCPILNANVSGGDGHWLVQVTMSGKDVTSQIRSADGLSFIGLQRLWPGASKRLRMTLTRAAGTPPIKSTNRPVVTIAMRSNPCVKVATEQTLVLQPTLVNMSNGENVLSW